MHPVEALKTYRKSEKLTQGDLAEKLGVARTTVARWEAGARKIDGDLLSQVSEQTGIPKDVLRPDMAELMRPVEAAE